MRIVPRALAIGLVFAALPVVTASPARAEGPVWRYVEAGYLNVDTEDLSESGDNYFLGGAFGLGKHFHIIGQWSNGELGPDVDLTTWRLGLGWHGLLGDKADVVGEAYYVDQTVDAPGASSEGDNGYRLTAGVRWVPIKLFEADGFAHYTDVGEGTDTSWEARGIINIWRLGFGASYEQLDNANQWNGFVRFNFGRP
jgi:hypothetical protein